MIETLFIILVIVAIYLIWWGKQPDEDYGTKIIHASVEFKEFIAKLNDKDDRDDKDDRVGR